MTKKVFLRTYGCQMNEYDTELVRAILFKAGFVLIGSEGEADIVLLNTCAVRENAHRKVYGQVHAIRHRRKERGGDPVMIGILGCMATGLRQDLLDDKHLNVDLIVGPDSYKRLPALIEEACRCGQKAFDVTLSEFETYADVEPQRNQGGNAWIAVMRGCNNFCTFCIVPYTRGRERSRSPQDIVAETRKLVDDGFKQVTLLGQNVNSYHYEDAAFADLLEAVSAVEGIERVRFTSPHPKDFPEQLLNVMTRNPKVCKHIHLPLQAGNNHILQMMNRSYTHEEFISLVANIRGLCPTMALSTDIIIGFPTETDAEFEDTFRVMQEVQFDSAFIFKYSPRKGTIANRKYKDDVPEEKKTQRIIRLNALQKEICLNKNASFIGTTQKILIEQSDPGDIVRGRTDGHRLVVLPKGSASQGELITVKITKASPNGLTAKCV